MIKISIIVPIYNVKEYLDECITSIIQQSMKELEIILVDDGSTDGSSTICDKYAKLDDRIKVIHKQNEGLVSARKAGLMVAKGEYIGYVDGDDFVDTGAYEHMYSLITKYKAQVIAAGITVFEEKGSYIKENEICSGVYKEQKLIGVRSKMFFCGNFYTPGIMPSLCNKLFEKELLYKFQMEVPENIRMGEDVCCSYPLFMHAKKIVVDNECAQYYYRNTTGSMTAKYDDGYFERVWQLKSYLKEQITDEYMQKTMNVYFVYLIHLGMERLWSKKANNLSFLQKKRVMDNFEEQLTKTENIDKYLKLPIPFVIKCELWIIKYKIYRMMYFITRIVKKMI